MATLTGKIANGLYTPPYKETDPTVPEHVKKITEEDISNWNDSVGAVLEENDPTVPKYVKNITQEQITKWDNPEVFSGDYNDLNNKPIIPAKTSQLVNDRGFITNYNETDPTVPEYVKSITKEEIQKWNNPEVFSGDYNDLSNKPTIPTVPTKTSELINDSGFIADYNETDPTVPSHVKAITQEQITKWDNPEIFSGDYNDLSNKPNIPTMPTNISQLVNDSGFITGYTETDPTVPSHVKNITEQDIAKWNSGTGSGTGNVDLSNYATKEDIQNITREDVFIDGPPAKAGFKRDGKDVYVIKHSISIHNLTTSTNYLDHEFTNVDVSKIKILFMLGAAYTNLGTAPYFLPIPGLNIDVRYFYNQTKGTSGYYFTTDKTQNFNWYTAEWEVYFIYLD